jgi:hypothetical protein
LHERAFRFLRRLPVGGSAAAAGTLFGCGLHSRAASHASPLVSLHRLLTSYAAAASPSGFWLLHLPPNPGALAQAPNAAANLSHFPTSDPGPSPTPCSPSPRTRAPSASFGS